MARWIRKDDKAQEKAYYKELADPERGDQKPTLN
jgi:hypothetical protein